ncbi:MAG: hypothetical protein WCK98_00550 [bacterium]
MSPFYKRIFALIIASCLIIFSALGTFTSGAGVMMTLRDYDASIGLISRPKDSFNKMGAAYNKLFPQVKVEAIGDCAGPCASEAGQQTRWSLDQALNKLLRQLVMAFVQAFLNFLLQQFQKLLDTISQWAQTLFGVKLNTCEIMRYVAIQAYTLQNKIETSVGDFADATFGPLKDTNFVGGASTATRLKTAQSIGKVSSTVADAVAAAETRKAIETADQNYPQCARNKPVGGATASQQQQQLSQTINTVAEIYCNRPVEEIVGKGEDSITVAGKTAWTFVAAQCLDTKSIVSNFRDKLNSRAQTTATNAQTAVVKQGQQSPPNCGGGSAIMKKNDAANSEIQNKLSGKETGSVPPLSVIRGEIVAKNDSERTINSLGDIGDAIALASANSAWETILDNLSSTNKVEPLDQNQCNAGDKVTASYKALDNSKNQNSSGGEGDLLDAILQTLQEFIKSIIDSLIQLITDIILKIVDKVFQALSGIGGGIFANAFNEFSSGLKTEISVGLQNLGTDVKKTVDEAFKVKN